MDREEARARMREVQRIMERTTLYSLLPGMSAVVGGVLCLAGCAASYGMFRSLDFSKVLEMSIQAQTWFCLMWTMIGALCVVQHMVLTARAAARQGISPMPRPARFATYSLTPSVLVAVVLTVRLLVECQMDYIAPVWMMCYGTGVYTAGLFSVRLPRLLGLAFIVSGAVGLLHFPQYGVVLAALSFGLFHIVFGLVVMGRTRRNGEE